MSTVHIFDPSAVKLHRRRAASAIDGHDFLLAAMADRLADRLGDFTRAFPQALMLEAFPGSVAEVLKKHGGIQTLTHADVDHESLSFEESFDLALSAGALHWVNDLPGMLVQMRRALKKDGLMMAIFPGGETLKELRESLEQAEIKITGGVSPRISPFVDVRDAGALLQRAGFAMPVADSETITIQYEDPLDILYDLRGMGEANALLARQKKFTRRGVFSEAMRYYREKFRDAEGRAPATVEFITVAGWK